MRTNIITFLIVLSSSLSFSQNIIKIDSLMKKENSIFREIESKKAELDKVHQKIYDLVSKQKFDELDKNSNISRYIILKSDGKLREKPDAGSQVVLNCVKGDILKLISFEKGFWKAFKYDQFGYISEEYFQETAETESTKKYILENKIDTSKNGKSDTKVQCAGKTQKGVRCINKTKNQNGYCHVHQSQVGCSKTKTKSSTYKSSSKPKTTAIRCSATTKSGTRCKRMTKSTNGKCYQHGGN